MKFGFGIPCCREGITLPVGMVTTQGMIDLAKAADNLGFYSVWFDDYRAPSPSMKISPPQIPNWFEPLTTISYLASITKQVRFGTGIMVLPLREPVLLAKQVATLDALSGGRIFLGVGLGLHRDEFKLINPAMNKVHRGEMLNEILESIRILLDKDVSKFSGKYFEFEDISINPKPIQKNIPLYFVSMIGDTKENLNRLVKWGNGFLIRPSVDHVNQRLETLKPILDQSGSDLSGIEVICYGVMSIASTRKEALERYKLGPASYRSKGMTDQQIVDTHFIGTPNEIIEKVQKLREAGVGQCVANTFPMDSMEEMLEQVKIYGEEIIPAFR